MIPVEEHITVKTFRPLCDSEWDGATPPESGIVYCPIDAIHKFFTECHYSHAYAVRRYVVVSSCCDYGVVYQDTNHPNADLRKWVDAIDWRTVSATKGDYGSIQLGPACETKNCTPSHKYSIKMYARTHATFLDMPVNILAWYTTNLAVRHRRMHWLPFGVNEEDTPPAVNASYQNKEKPKLLYLNWQNHTKQRIDLKNHYRQRSWATVRDAGLPVEQFLTDISEHKFTLCPSGNGLDCYRTYEALYLGSIPVMERSDFSDNLRDLPVLIVPSLFDLHAEHLEHHWMEMKQRIYNTDKLTKSYWKSQFDSWRKRLVAV